MEIKDSTQLLIFDLDGTLVDSFPGLLVGMNLTLDEFELPRIDLDWIARHIGRGSMKLVTAAACGRVDPLVLHEVFLARYAEVMVAHTPPFPGVDRTLEELNSRFTMAVASNKPLHMVDELVDRLGWRRLMDVVVGPETANAHKPDPAMIEHVLTHTGCTRSQTVYIGDMLVDVETGANAGIPVIGIASGATSAEQLTAAGCDAVVGEISELVEFFGF